MAAPTPLSLGPVCRGSATLSMLSPAWVTGYDASSRLAKASTDDRALPSVSTR